MHSHKRKLIYSPMLTIVLILSIGMTSVLAAPTDPFNGDNPSPRDESPEAESYNAGDWGVSEQRGAATYTYPISLPPSRNDVVPSLALRYSSQLALRGGLAVGWTMEIPAIRIDSTLGYEGETRFSASVDSASGRLVEAPDELLSGYNKAYRVNFDRSFTRFFRKGSELNNYSWMALTSDGMRYYFDHPVSAAEELPWVVTRQSDPFGNTIHYHWSPVTTPLNIDTPVELRLDAIEYAENSNAGLPAHARIEFNYAPLDLCPDSNVPIGAASYGDGKLDGASRLNEIAIMVRDMPESGWRLSRRIDLGYVTDSNGFIPCEQGEAPLRYLNRIIERAWDSNGEESVLPPVTFAYNRQVANLDEIPFTTVDVTGYPSAGHYRGAVQGMLDLDSDGIQDHITVTTENNLCVMVWNRGLLGGGFENTERRANLPTASWIYGNVPIAGELCTFSGQKTLRARLGNLPNNNDCELPPSQATLSYHFMDVNNDGRVDLLTNVWAAENEWASMHPPFLTEPPQCDPNAGQNKAGREKMMAPLADQPEPEIPILNAPHMEPERNPANNRFLWRVYMNTGGSNIFESFPSLTMQTPPINLSHPNPTTPGQPRINPPSLSPSASESGVIEGWSSSMPSLVDLDGDGYLDFVDVGQDQAGLGSTDGKWEVYFGLGDGTFSETAHDWQILPLLVSGSNEPVSTEENGWVHSRRETVAAVQDLSGDGLPDLVVFHGGNELKMYRNTGSGFSRDAVPFAIDQPLEILLTDYEGTLQQTTIHNGQREYSRRLIDVDGDGLADIVDFPPLDAKPNLPLVRYNIGDRFLAPQQLHLNWRSARRQLSVVNGEWSLDTDVSDDGDGISDLANWQSGGQQRTFRNIGYTTAPRTLSQVDNGRGMTIHYHYRPSTDPAVVQWTQAEKTYLPSAKWVVAKVEVDGGFGTPPMVKEYTYADPAYQSATAYTTVPESSRFQGFRRTTMTTVPFQTAQGNDVARKQIMRRYAYDESGSPDGRLVEEWTYIGTEIPSNIQFRLHEYQARTWTRHAIFKNNLYVSLPATHSTRICLPGASAAECMVQTANLHQVTESWEPYPSAGDARLYLHKTSRESTASILSLGDRRTEYNYEVRYGQAPYSNDDYRILPTLTNYQTARQGREGPIFADTGRKEIIYDAATGLPAITKEWQDAGTIATTERTFDPQTGNLITKTKPQQIATGGQGSSYVYDAHKVTVAMVSNELDQKVYMTHDIATGELMERRGPNSIQQGSDFLWEGERFTIDGFGRVVEYAVAVDDPISGQPYAYQPIAKTTYFDEVLPNRVRVEQRIDFDDNRWTRVDNALDGMGRLLSETTILDGGIPTVTTHGYDSAGNRTYLEVPDPRFDDESTVVHRYHYDGLGRVTGITRPDNTSVSITYAGLEQTTKEITLDGSGATRKEVYDVYERLLEVHETNPETGNAITRYSYDSNDNVTRIIDADSNVTTMQHNWASQRTSIRRGTRQWNYHYDLNGNLLREEEPMVAGADPTLHTVTREYDDLDRLLSVTYADPMITEFPEDNVPGLTLGPDTSSNQIYLPIVAHGGASNTASVEASVQAAATTVDSELVTVEYSYDQGPNGVGRLSAVEQRSSTIEYLIQYSYEARGLPIQEQREVQLPGVVADLTAVQSVERSYNALGAMTQSTWDDGQMWRIGFDIRGLVDIVEWFDPNRGDWQQVADYYRSPSGLIRERLSSYGQQRSITYDILSRPETDQVMANGATIAQRTYGYNDAGNLRSVTGQTNGVSANASYTYDAQHRLRTASGPNGYQGTFTYSFAGNIKSADVTWQNSTATRNVQYEYGDLDPQAVDRLVNVSGGKNYAAFSYDLAGNMTVRQAPEGLTKLTWDGLDRIRMAETPNGPEVYYYDHEGNRMLAINQDGSRFWFAERETHYDLGGSEVHRYLHLSDSAGTIARADETNALELQYADALQNLMVAVDTQGNVASSFLYGPFGEVLQATGADTHRRQFNGKENDTVTGLRYYGYRYYDPLILRWNSADPLYQVLPDLGIHEPQRMNLYSFSLNNPVRYYDPDGRDATDEVCTDPSGMKCDPPVPDISPDEEEQVGDCAQGIPCSGADDPEFTDAEIENVCSDSSCDAAMRAQNPTPDQVQVLMHERDLLKAEQAKLKAQKKQKNKKTDYAEEWLSWEVGLIEVKDSDSGWTKAGKIAGTIVSPVVIGPTAIAGWATNEVRDLASGCVLGVCLFD